MKTSTKVGLLGLIASGVIAGIGLTSGSDLGNNLESIANSVVCSSTAFAGQESEEKSRRETYAVLSGNANAYNNGRITDAEVEKNLGLSREDIKELTHDFFNFYVYDIKGFTDAIPGLNKDQLKTLMDKNINPSFVEYAVRAGEFDMEAMTRALLDKNSNAFTNYLLRLVRSDFENVMCLYNQFEKARLSPFYVKFYTPTERLALPEEISFAARTQNSDKTHFVILWDKGYSLDDIKKLAINFIYVTEFKTGEFDYFMKLGITDADEAIELEGKYGNGVAEVLCNEGLTFDDMPFIDKLGGKETEKYARAGMKGDIESMLFLHDHDVNGDLAMFYSDLGITDKNHMALLARRNINEGMVSDMQKLGFIGDSKTYRLGELIIAHDAYKSFQQEYMQFRDM